jgi:2-oxoglutarate/2-oxoacid ferredoxin oxidoreductase subunit alpha
VHLRHLHPLHPDLGALLGAFEQVLVPEMNLGQLSLLLRARYLVDARPISKVQGKPFSVDELSHRIEEGR